MELLIADARQQLDAALVSVEALKTQLHELTAASENKAPYLYSRAYDDLTSVATALSAYGECLPQIAMPYSHVAASVVIDGIIVLKMPMPKRRTGPDSAYTFHAAVNGLLIREICPQLSDSINLDTVNALTLAYAPATSARQRHAIDHDNYYIKPIIDSVCAALGIDDGGASLSLCHYLLPDPELAPWMYAIVTPGPDCITRAEAIRLCSSPKLHDKKSKVDKN